ncbi:hypothetical protein BpHYR1_000318 [Brachionus plicatilis]|uniref:Uncharacterized protein n=1 Tax=Brachionus plicatilis TaxID=10195 RepID=A0A3M7SIB2_BRAPC|nr:hypothetical protein BpHYR1_000318 [Brachionus plicatilis]
MILSLPEECLVVMHRRGCCGTGTSSFLDDNHVECSSSLQMNLANIRKLFTNFYKRERTVKLFFSFLKKSLMCAWKTNCSSKDIINSIKIPVYSHNG